MILLGFEVSLHEEIANCGSCALNLTLLTSSHFNYLKVEWICLWICGKSFFNNIRSNKCNILYIKLILFYRAKMPNYSKMQLSPPIHFLKSMPQTGSKLLLHQFEPPLKFDQSEQSKGLNMGLNRGVTK